jgi:2-oxoglutarate dehydrogenase complex dehydrogenase (E1) component-like enzyme
MFQIGKKISLFKKSNCNLNSLTFKKFSNNLSNDSFINGTSGIYVERMFENWKKDQKSVHTSWDIYFSNIEQGKDVLEAFQSPPNIDKGKINRK